MIIDCFIYSGEDKMLNFRLHELNNKVNYFIIVESTYSFSGIKKDLKFNINNYEKFKDKILYLIYNEVPSSNAWDNEGKTRDYLKQGLKLISNLQDNDIIMLSDVDEIPDLEKMDQFTGFYNTFLNDFYYYNLDCMKKIKFHGTVITKNSLLNNNITFQYLRNIKNQLPLIKGGMAFFLFYDNK